MDFIRKGKQNRYLWMDGRLELEDQGRRGKRKKREKIQEEMAKIKGHISGSMET